MKECIILAGGLGTRLQSVVSDVPKCMAEVAGRPFLSYLFDYAAEQQFGHLILSLGYKSEVVLQWLTTQSLPFQVSYVIEDYPLGTGGAIKLALSKVKSPNAFVFNGDTFFDVDTTSFLDFHEKSNALISLALKPMTDFDRYGSVDLADGGRVIRFNEKRHCKQGFINGGVYIINKDLFSTLNLPEKFSFEKDVMEACLNDMPFYGCVQDGYFIDIGIPSDFAKANLDFREK
ncbi:D-mannose-1-phosphate guanyltransferase [Dysgonomonas sp. 521]|uniref:nucleotidyltransferase family protein n=1 Tax=Dysgonomonas sp. 521 TaxID=2302932 RepID=UPI0013D7DABC|nr:nucleotidyltransferase family protein [Dysgonomonas sp. 521]NDV95993.1 D-mannose-1-phosphate guanyltransferase [Dysgonomonas sp. 521]